MYNAVRGVARGSNREWQYAAEVAAQLNHLLAIHPR